MITQFEQAPVTGDYLVRVVETRTRYNAATRLMDYLVWFDSGLQTTVSKAVYDEVEKRILANPKTAFRLRLVAE